MRDAIFAHSPYFAVIILMMTGLYIVFARENLIKKIVGLNIFQTSVFIFYIVIGKVSGGTAPILPQKHGGKDDHGKDAGHGAPEHGAGDHGAAAGDHGGEAAAHGAEAAHGAGEIVYSNPLPHVLILTAIVVGVATTAVGLALAVRIREAYGTLEDTDLREADEANAVTDARVAARVQDA